MRSLALVLVFLLSMRHVARAQVVSGETAKAPSQAALQAASQAAQLKGIVKDTLNQSIPQNAVILLVNPGDSTLAAFTRVDAKGRFDIPKVLPGPYLLWISHPAFATYRDSVHLGPGANDLGNIFLTLRSKILQEVIIRGIPPMRMKGDTIEYAADSFAVRPNATVEDLLKRMPGIEVDKNGKITAQGQSVATVLVDGEEFFGDDPTVATRGLPANAVEKVQVYDKKSDEAAFTGIDDGKLSRTINLQLKKDKKNGYFGKVDAGAGSDGYYQNNAALNLFEKKRKIAFYLVDANTGTAGLGYQDQRNYSSNTRLPTVTVGDLVNMFPGGSGDFTNWSGSYNGEGVPAALNFGGLYSNKWEDDKISLNGDYNYNQVKVGVLDNTTSQLILPDSIVNNSQDRNYSYVTDVQHAVDGKYEIDPDSSSEIKVFIQDKMRHKNTLTQDSSYTTNGDNQLLNQNVNNTNISGQDNTYNTFVVWQKKFKKKGRTLYSIFQENYNEINSTGYQHSLVTGYDNGTLLSIDTTDQYKTSYNRTLALQTQFTYTEPLSASAYLVADYGFGLLSGTSDKNAYNKDAQDKYQALDTTYSDYYNLNILTNSGGLSFRKAAKKYGYSAGLDVGYTGYRQDNIYQDSLQHRNFLNWYPKASFNYKLSGSSFFYIEYNGNSTQPSLQQLQPVANNDNPLNIQIGNTSLKPSFSNNIWLYYTNFNILSGRSFYSNVSYTFQENAFSNRDSVSATGVQYSQAVNVQGTSNASGFFDYGIKLKKLDMRAGLSSNDTYSRNTSFVNGQENDTKSAAYNLGIYLDKEKVKVYTFRLNASASYNTSVSSIQTTLDTKYWTSQIGGEVSKDLPWKFLVDVNADANFRQKTPLFTSNANTFLCNVFLAKMFLKDESLMLKFTASDIFNQNTGFNRSIGTNAISQSVYTAIHRYFMLSVNYNFAKNGKPQQNGIIQF